VNAWHVDLTHPPHQGVVDHNDADCRALTPLRKMSAVTTMATSAQMSQPTPVLRRSRGSGGGAPDGRRRVAPARATSS
jgi:hypothetical protein